MSTKVAELRKFLTQDEPSQWVSYLWDTYNNQRREKIEEWKEMRDYIFATDTSTTSNGALPWKNTTTLPKLCQIRDNLHSNYLSALFPNDSWLRWQGYSVEDSLIEKAANIEAYMANKTRVSDFRNVMSQTLLDYIDYGNAFAYPDFVSQMKEMPDGTVLPAFVGPVGRRISPLDIVFNPLANSFDETHKVVRSIKSLGEVKKLAETNPDQAFWKEALDSRLEKQSLMGSYSQEDFDKAVGYSADGFGNMYEYFMSDYMEVLEFYGDYHNTETGELKTDMIITVVDRCKTVREEKMPQWYAGSPIVHVSWRKRPDNLWGMGPLDNLVGLQYRLDHLENLKADAMDLIIHPPLKIIGEVEQFRWAPGVEIHIDEGGSDVQELGTSMGNIFGAAQEMQQIEDRMELYAGAPREAMGVRTPGEKTAFEVQELSNASTRIFQEKINHFEIEFLEKLLNKMLETAQRNMDMADVIRVFDNDIGAEVFSTLTVDDITAHGLLQPIGARHFAKKAQDLQNLTQVMNSSVGQMVQPHTSALELTRFIDDSLGLKGYDIFKENVNIKEQQSTQSAVNMAQENIAAEQATPVI
ncbi:head-to-tail joining protein [Vibrio phage 1.253.O._10N.286.45.B12]|nr:head-to-tail joining protein [Vibrio phage 1.235.O._10N.261.52.B2]AUR98532.1 head-to-tail joining protein [Vibrio phage 1.253.O._10N.286.45.B12]